MNDTEKVVLVGAGLVALAIFGGSVILSIQLRNSLAHLDLWKDSGVPQVLNDVHQVTGTLAPIGRALEGWTRA